MTTLRDDILKALDQVIDPVSGRTVVQQNMIQGLVVKDGHVGFALEVAARPGPESEPLRKICEAMVLGVKGVISVTAVLTAHEDGPSAEHEHHRHASRTPETGASQPPAATRAAGIPGVTNIIAVASGKGGVGKSTVAVNLALGSGAAGAEGGPAGCRHLRPLGAAPAGHHRKARTATARSSSRSRNMASRPCRIGFLVKEDEAMIWRGPMVQIGPDPDDDRCAVGAAGCAGAGHAARHRRRPAHHRPARAAQRRGDRFHPAGHRPDRRHAKASPCSARPRCRSWAWWRI